MEQAHIDVAYIAKLAKLELTEEETRSFSQDQHLLVALICTEHHHL